LWALLEALADLYRKAACGEIEAVYQDGTSQAEKTRIMRRFNENEIKIATVVGRFFKAFVPCCVLTTKGARGRGDRCRPGMWPTRRSLYPASS